jgi:tetratricopeptide (TPR) repeat protein
MSADYRAEIDELSRLRDEVARLGPDRDLGYLAHYWSGFASWRMAINGANHQMKTEDMKTHLQKAATEFYRSLRLKDDFADAYAAAALVNSWLATFYLGSNPDNVMVGERASLSLALYSRASALDPENPRVLWAKGAFLLFAPVAPELQAGNIARAIEVYRRMLEAAERRGVNAASPLPDWGKPEALMSLAFAHTKQTPPDLRAALDEANAALKLEPDWSYVRDNLIPQIERRLRPDPR